VAEAVRIPVIASLTITDANGCVATDEVTVTVYPFLFYAQKRVYLSHFDRAEGDIGSNRDVVFDDGRGSVVEGSIFAVRNVIVDKKNIVTNPGNITADGSIDIHPDATVDGEIGSGWAGLPLPALSFTAGGSDLIVEKDEEDTLAPGSYDVVRGMKDAIIYLSSGKYYLNRLVMDGEAQLNLDLSGGPITINVVDRLLFRKDSEIIIKEGTGSSEDITINYLGTRTAVFDKGGKFQGSIIAPRAKVELGSGSGFLGSICGRRVEFRKDARARFHGHPGGIPKPGDELAENEEAVTDYELSQNYPNPFSSGTRLSAPGGGNSTTIKFALPEPGTVKLQIYDLMGGVVRTLVNRSMPAGRHQLNWDGRNRAGERVAAGTYIYRMTVQRENGAPVVITKKLTFLK